MTAVAIQPNGNGKVKTSTTLVSIAPRDAQRMLAGMEANRLLSQQHVQKLSRDMKAGKWRDDNGETIKLDTLGKVIDGQHRLQAVIQSGVTIRSLVVSGIPTEARTTIDTGRARKFSDHLAMNGSASPLVLAGALGWMLRYENNDMLSTNAHSHDELADALERHPDLAKSVSGLRSSIVPPSAAAFTHYMGFRLDPVKANEFVYMIGHGTASDGTGLNETHAVFQLRERFIANRSSKSRLTRVEALALIITAWNYYAMDRAVKNLRWRARGKAAQDFPRFIGETASE